MYGRLQIDYFCCVSIVTSPEGEYALAKYDEMIDLLLNLDEEIFMDWCDLIPEDCETHLTKTLLLVDPDTRLLELNFAKEVSLCEIRSLFLD